MDVAPLSTFQIFILPYDIRCVAAAELKKYADLYTIQASCLRHARSLLAYTSVRDVVQ